MQRSSRDLMALAVLGVVGLTPERTAAQRTGSVVSILLGGNATRFEASAWQVGGAVTVATRSGESRGTALSLNAGGGVSRSSFGTTFTVADATPAVEFSVGPVTIFGGGHVASARTTVRSAPSPTPGQNVVPSMTRTSTAPVYGAQWVFGGLGSPQSASVSYRGEHARVADESVVDRSGGAAVAFGPVSLGGTYGDRASVSERARFAAGTVSIGLSRDVTLDARASDESIISLTTQGGVSLGVGGRMAGQASGGSKRSGAAMAGSSTSATGNLTGTTKAAVGAVTGVVKRP